MRVDEDMYATTFRILQTADEHFTPLISQDIIVLQVLI